MLQQEIVKFAKSVYISSTDFTGMNIFLYLLIKLLQCCELLWNMSYTHIYINLTFIWWGKLKGSVYADNPRTTDELTQKITSVIQNIKSDQFECVFQNAQRRACLCLHTLSTVIVDFFLLHESILNRTGCSR